MSPIKRKDSPYYYVDVRWRGYPRLRLSTDTPVKARAVAMERSLFTLRANGRRDLLEMLADRRLSLPELHAAMETSPEQLKQLAAKASSPPLGKLVDEWLDGLPFALNKRKQPYALRTIERYRVSWEGFFSVIPQGREAPLSALTDGFVQDYRRSRRRAVGGKKRMVREARASAATINRDLAAMGAFFSWLEGTKRAAFVRPKLTREHEPQGRERWLSAEELQAFERACPVGWWPLFATLFLTGLRLSEATGLRGGDVRLQPKGSRLQVHEGTRRVKSRTAVRTVPVPERLRLALQAHLDRNNTGPDDLVFPDACTYAAVRRVWDATCRAAGITGATPHDARHTYGVHAALAGVPIVRLQRLLGHATAHMTLRYMQHSPQAYLDEDSALIEQSMASAERPDEARRTQLRLA